MKSEICDQITCGIISVMAVVYLVMSRNVLFAVAAVILCGFMWWSVCYKDVSIRNFNFIGTAHNTNVYLVVLLGLYVAASSGLTWKSLSVVKDFFLKPVIIGWIVVIIVGRFVIKAFFHTGYIPKIIGLLLNSVLYVAAAGFFTGTDSALFQAMFTVTVFAALLSLSRILQNAPSQAVLDTSWSVIVLTPFLLADIYIGNSQLYLWFVLGQSTTPVWWVTIGLIAIAAVNLCVELSAWKRASFGASIILFLVTLYYGKIFGTEIHLGMVIICALLADLVVKYFIGKCVIKDKTYELLIAYVFFIPVTLLFSSVAARHNDLVLLIAVVLLLGAFAVINWKISLDFSAAVFIFGMAFTALFLSVRYVNGGEKNGFLVLIAAIFWLILALGFGRNRLYKTAVEDTTMSGVMKYILYLFAAAALCISLYTVTQMKTVFYLEKQKTAAVVDIEKIGAAFKGEDDSKDADSKDTDSKETAAEENTEDNVENKDDEAEKKAEPVIVKGVINGNAEDIKSITMEWDEDQVITCTAEEAAKYSAELPSSKVKITVEMNDGSLYVNQQYFFVGKRDADEDTDADETSEDSEDSENSEEAETSKENEEKK